MAEKSKIDEIVELIKNGSLEEGSEKLEAYRKEEASQTVLTALQAANKALAGVSSDDLSDEAKAELKKLARFSGVQTALKKGVRKARAKSISVDQAKVKDAANQVIKETKKGDSFTFVDLGKRLRKNGQDFNGAPSMLFKEVIKEAEEKGTIQRDGERAGLKFVKQ